MTDSFLFPPRRLRTALPKIPVPPVGRDMTLNYEKLIDKNVSWYALFLFFYCSFIFFRWGFGTLCSYWLGLCFFTYSHSSSALTFFKRELEQILEPDLRQIAELEAEIEREQKRLEQDEDYYQKLKKNAVSQETVRRQKARSVSKAQILNIFRPFVPGLMCCVVITDAPTFEKHGGNK